MTKDTNRKVRIVFHEILFMSAVALFFIVLVMIAMGYRLRRHSEGGVLPSWERTTMLRVGSFPTGANITLNGNDTGRRTTLSSQRLVISTGNHSIRVARDGFHPWSHSFTAVEGEITWFDYIQLFPINRSSDIVQSFSSARQVWHSPVGERALVIAPAAADISQRLHIISLATTNVSSSSVHLPSNITNPDMIVWSRDEGLVLLCERKDPEIVQLSAAARRAANATDRCVMVDADRGRLTATNLPIQSTENLLSAAFVNSRTMLVVTSSRAFLFDINSSTAQELDVQLPENNLPEQLAITATDVTLLYHTRVSAGGETTYHLSTVNANGTITTIFTDEQPFEFTATRYLNDFVVAITNNYQLRIYFSSSSGLFSNINGLDLQYDFAMPTAISTIVARGRFITTTNGLAVDLERNVITEFDNVCHSTRWQNLSSAQLFCPNSNDLLIKDFDGTNRISIRMPDDVTMPAPITPSGEEEIVYSIPVGFPVQPVMPATIVNRRTLYYWTIAYINDIPQLQLRQLRLN
ncbi:PEGA domain-containing protein [Candidatus Saccharibacteria bacterium]|nr:PEGA domain-containing protein [Candidatus Saccharibacteria bacterium]